MPWTFYNANGQRLSSAATNISVLDIDGATDIGADIVDADLFIIDDGAGGTNRKTAASRIKTYIGSAAVTRVGGNTTEATTTSTSATDLISATSLTIATTEIYMFSVVARKTSGATAQTVLGHKENSTVVYAATGGNVGLWISAANDEASSGSLFVQAASRVTNYLIGNLAGTRMHRGPNQVTRTQGAAPEGNGTAAHVNAEITSLVVMGTSDNASNTLGADELHVYENAVS